MVRRVLLAQAGEIVQGRSRHMIGNSRHLALAIDRDLAVFGFAVYLEVDLTVVLWIQSDMQIDPVGPNSYGPNPGNVLQLKMMAFADRLANCIARHFQLRYAREHASALHHMIG
ncbi:hypothetical protein DYGSA30_32780 [Dyella sp. GSA-30]|nr:hypothetical protein DYGSA30_32780 [Dyella sp. GSA-30]